MSIAKPINGYAVHNALADFAKAIEGSGLEIVKHDGHAIHPYDYEDDNVCRWAIILKEEK
jgi:hypothetical protein